MQEHLGLLKRRSLMKVAHELQEAHDALFAANLNKVFRTVALTALEVYAIATPWLPQDTTTMALYGAYTDAPPTPEALHAVLPSVLNPWPLRLHESPVIALVAFCTRPVSTPRQDHGGMYGRTNLTAKVR